MEKNIRPIILCGIKHCGKSTQGKLLSQKLGLNFYDTDDLIQQNEGRSAREIYTQDGKDSFMAAEKRAVEFLENLLNGRPAVVATGGGICDNQDAVLILQKMGTIVFLQAEEKIAADRIVREAVVSFDKNGKEFFENLPAYIAKDSPQNESQVRSLFHEFYVARTEKYKKIAGITIQMGGADKLENCNKILAQVKSLTE